MSKRSNCEELEQRVRELEQAIKVLEDRENRYHSLIKGIPVGLYRTDEDSRIIEANPALAEILGFSDRESLLSMKSSGFYVRPEDQEEQRRILHLDGVLRGFETQLRRSDGSVIWVRDSAQAFHRPDGRTFYEGSLENITERKRAEEALQASGQLMRSILDNSPMPKFVIDERHRIIYWNQALEKYSGIKAKDVIGTAQQWRAFYDHDRPCLADLLLDGESDGIRKLYAGKHRSSGLIEGAMEAIDFFPDMKGGTWLYFTAALMHDARGNITGAIETLIDITDRKRAEEALSQSEKQFRLLVESSPDVIFVETEGRFVYVNKAAVEIFGVDGPEDLMGQPVMDRFHPDFREIVREWICPGSREKMSVSHLEQTCLRMDGSPVSVEVSAVPVHYAGSDGALVFVRDISERLEGEKIRRALEEQLAQAQKMEAVGRLAGGVAHDLNNLLSPVLGYGEMLIEDFSIEDSRRQSAEEIVGAGYRARDLVRQLLAFSRKQTLEFKVVDANRAIMGLKKLLRRTLREDIQIDLNLASGLPPIKGDVGQIEQIILNLAINAQDAMPDGGVLAIESVVVDLDEVYAEKHQGVTPGRYVLLAVSDTGHGMDEEAIERVFEPFYTTKQKGKGTGLGLSTVYGIVKQHGGNIQAFSKPNHGSTFRCYFPAIDYKEFTVEEINEIMTADLEGNETIIVVEDDESVRKIAVAILMRQGYNVHWASNGEDCIQILQKHKDSIKLLVTDVVMPDMNGRQLHDRVIDLAPNIKVLYVSGYPDNVIAHHGVLENGINFIQKPFSVSGLAEKVRQVMDED